MIIKLGKDFPNIQEEFDEHGVRIKIEFNSLNSFIKRISIDSPRVKLSLYLQECDLEKPINDLFFKSDPVFEYK